MEDASKDAAAPVRVRFEGSRGKFALSVPRDVHVALVRELRETDIRPDHFFSESAEVLPDVLLFLSGISIEVMLGEFLRRFLDKHPRQRISLEFDGKKLDATNYSADDLVKVITAMKE